MILSRTWAMPSPDTFQCKPIGEFVARYATSSRLSIDPFARNARVASMTNDLNPETQAQSHMNALDWLAGLKAREVQPDLVIFDPPYSLEQLKRVYENCGLHFARSAAQNGLRWSKEKAVISDLCPIGAYVLSFGWNTCGMGIQHGFEIVEILIVSHGAGHHDTLCTAEKKIRHQNSLFVS